MDDDAPFGGDGQSWNTAFKYLQDALHVAQAGDEIRVAQGTYMPDRDEAGLVTPGSRSASFQLTSGMSLCGGYAGRGAPNPNERNIELYETRLSGEINDPPLEDNSLHVLTGTGAGASTCVEGFVVLRGYVVEYWKGCGAGILIESNEFRIAHCTFLNNTADCGGGAAIMGGHAMFEHCAFVANTAIQGGGAYNEGVGVFVHCRFVENIADARDVDTWGVGGGYCDYHGDTELRDCEFVGNIAYGNMEWNAALGGGFGCGLSDRVLIVNCEFRENDVVAREWGGGGVGVVGTRAQLVNCVLHRNDACAGTALLNLDWVSMRNCVVVNDDIAVESRLDITDSILWRQGPDPVLKPSPSGSVTVTYSNVSGGWPGVGNIDEDPMFVDFVGGDFHLLPDSPCIDRGDPAFVPEPGHVDVDGEYRLWDGDANGEPRVDMGVDEFGSYRFGDLNCDTQISFGDINPFVLALTDPTAYGQQFPACSKELADVNADGEVDFGDINPFVRLLTAP